MVTAAALIHGPQERLLTYSEAEHPVALQLGGSDPDMLAQAVRIALPYGYDEINLNVGCPSDRVQSGAFGACLMRTPELVAECVVAMMEAAGGHGPEITVKCRIGVDDQDPEIVLPDFIDQVAVAGVSVFAIHARKAWLEGLSPKQNRDVPPLHYDLAVRIKTERPDLSISINGGIKSLDQAEAFLAAGLDGVMIGRAAYHTPAEILGPSDRRIFGVAGPDTRAEDAALAMRPYIADELAKGARLTQITRHMLHLFAGRPGARGWRRTLSEGAHLPGAGLELFDVALSKVMERTPANASGALTDAG